MTRRRRLELLLLLGALAAMGSAAIDMYLPALPAIADELDVSPASTQLTFTTFLIGLGGGQLVAGPLSDAFGRRRPLLAGVGLYAAAAVVCALADSILVLAAARLAQGLAAAAGVVISRAIIRDLYAGADLARSYARLFLVVAVVPIVAPVLGTQVLALTSWRGIFALLFAFGGLLLVVATVRLPETLPVERRTRSGVRVTVRTFRSLLAQPTLVGYAATLGCVSGALSAAIAGAPFVVQDVYDRPPQVYGLVFLVGGVALLAATQLNARLLRRASPRRLLAFGLAATAAAGSLVLVAGGAALSVFAIAFVGLFAAYGFILSNAVALALREQAAAAGSAAAFVGLLQYGTGAVAAPLPGLAGGDTVAPLGLVVLAFSVAAGVIALLSVRGERRRLRAAAA